MKPWRQTRGGLLFLCQEIRGGASAYGQNLVTETGCEMYSVSNRGNSRVPYSCKETAHALLVEVEKARPFMGK